MSIPDDGKMPFLKHLEDLRGCLLRAVIVVFVTAIVCFTFASELFAFLSSPLLAHFDGVSLIGTGPAEAFIVKLKVAITCGLIISSPYTFYEVWRFISPGLYEKERRLAIPFVICSTACFVIGISFCFYLIFPFAFPFFLGEFESIGVAPTIRIGEYLTFVVKLLLVFGLVFELPVLSFFLSRFGILNHRWLIEKGRYSVVVIFVLAALLTPPDIITQLLLALPLLVLYGVCIGIAWMVHPTAGRNKSESTGSSQR